VQNALVIVGVLAILTGCANGGASQDGTPLDAVERAAVYSEHASQTCPGYSFAADAANADRAAQNVSVDDRISAAEKANSALAKDIDDGVYAPDAKYCDTLQDPAVLADLKYLAKNT